MTAEEIREKLGLLPWTEFYRRRQEKINKSPLPAKEWRGRRTGETTKMLLDALAALSEGKVVQINAYSKSYTMQLVKQCRDWAAQLGLNPLKIHPFQSRAMTAVFTDHYWGR